MKISIHPVPGPFFLPKLGTFAGGVLAYYCLPSPFAKFIP